MIPIAFAFDQALEMPAAVCISSLLQSAEPATVYDIFVVCRDRRSLDLENVGRVMAAHPRHRLTVREVSGEFDGSHQIRGINTTTYHRLLLADLIPEYDKLLYSDVDVIFREDLRPYFETDLSDCYFGVVRSCAHLDPVLSDYYRSQLHIDPTEAFYAGNLVINSALLRRDHMTEHFTAMADRQLKYQDMDILNLTCHGRVRFLPPAFCVTTYFCDMLARDPRRLLTVWSQSEIDHAVHHGLIHYNGPKPWAGASLNADIWWEAYRQSAIFDFNHYYDYFQRRIDLLDSLPLTKRLKILARYFIHGRK